MAKLQRVDLSKTIEYIRGLAIQLLKADVTHFANNDQPPRPTIMLDATAGKEAAERLLNVCEYLVRHEETINREVNEFNNDFWTRAWDHITSMGGK